MLHHAHPSHYFAKYLMSLGTRDSYDNNWVRATMTAHGCFPLTEEEAQEIREEISADMPRDYRPRDKRHKASTAFMRKHKVYSYHHPNEAHDRMVSQILTVPFTRELVERLLLGRLDPQFIATKLNSRYNLLLTKRSVDLYRHFFFNVDLLTLDDWQYHLRERGDYKTQMCIAQVGAPLAVFRAGLKQSIDSKHMLKRAQQMLFMTLLEVNEMPLSKEKVSMMTKLTTGLLRVDERLSQSDMALKEVLQQFERFRLKRNEDGPMSITQLAPNGAFAGSGRVPELPETVDAEMVEES